MYSFKYSFYPTGEDIDGYYSGELSFYLAALNTNGQMLGDWNIAQVGDVLEIACIAPDKDSLSQKRFNDYARAAYDRLMAQSSMAPEAVLVGPTVGLDETCHCASPSSYVLHTTFLNVEPPVVCGDCGGRVPLYRLPFYKDEKEYWTIQDWERTYKACDMLSVGDSGIGERFAAKEMANPASKLTVLGLEICKDMSSKLGKPFHYFLRTSVERLAKSCPACKTDWRVEEPLGGLFDLKCEACGFVAMSPSV